MAYLTYEDKNGVTKRLYFIDRGKGDILFLIHGWYQNSEECYQPYIEHFSAKYRVIAPDLPGHGKSYKSTEFNFSIQDSIQAMVTLIKHFKNEGATVHIAGASLGSYIALKIAIDYPDLIQCVVLISTLVDFKISEYEIDKLLKLNTIILYISLRYRSMQEKFPFDGRKSEYWRIDGKMPGKIEHYNQKMKNHPLHAARGYLKSFLNRTLLNDLPKNSKPVLLIYGKRDKLTPADFAESLARKMPRAVLRIIGNSGHNVYLTKPNEVIQHMEDFLQEHKKRSFKWLNMFWRR